MTDNRRVTSMGNTCDRAPGAAGTPSKREERGMSTNICLLPLRTRAATRTAGDPGAAGKGEHQVRPTRGYLEPSGGRGVPPKSVGDTEPGRDLLTRLNGLRPKPTRCKWTTRIQIHRVARRARHPGVGSPCSCVPTASLADAERTHGHRQPALPKPPRQRATDAPTNTPLGPGVTERG